MRKRRKTVADERSETATQAAEATKTAAETITDQLGELRVLLEEIEAARDNLEESFRETARYESIDEACSTLDAAVDGIEDAVSSINDAADEITGIEWGW